MGPQDVRGGTEVNAPIAESPRQAVPKLVASAGPGAGRALAMVTTFATVGRHPTNDLVIADPRVSGVHLELRRVGARTASPTWSSRAAASSSSAARRFGSRSKTPPPPPQ
jgi:hypothetical protein